MSQTYYQVLGVAETATEADIKAAYRKLALKYHPDKSDKPGDRDRFHRATEAYEALLDADRRKAYDAIQEAKRNPQPKPAPQPGAQSKSPPPAAPKPKAPTPEEVRRRMEEARSDRPVAQPKPRTDEVVKLSGLVARGRLVEAERLARKLVDQDVQHAIPYAVLGDLARMKGDFESGMQMYSVAIQFDAKNLVYQRRFEEMSGKVRPNGARIAMAAEVPTRPAGVILGIVVTLLCAAYLVTSLEAPIRTGLPLMETWTLGLILCLVAAGIAGGSGLGIAGFLESPRSVDGKKTTEAPLGLLVAPAALINFWIALVVFLLFTAGNGIRDYAGTRLFGMTLLSILVFTTATALHSIINPLEVAVWSGNILYGCGAMIWVLSQNRTRV